MRTRKPRARRSRPTALDDEDDDDVYEAEENAREDEDDGTTLKPL
jgi:hypothetical protein